MRQDQSGLGWAKWLRKGHLVAGWLSEGYLGHSIAVICVISMRPNITYVVSVTSRYQSYPSECHWIAVKHIQKYLRMTKDMLLIYGDSDFHIDGFIISNF